MGEIVKLKICPRRLQAYITQWMSSTDPMLPSNTAKKNTLWAYATV